MSETNPGDKVPYPNLEERLSEIHHRMTVCGGDVTNIKIVAVTKGHGVSAVRAALRVGLRNIGENYADELVAKAKQLEAEPVSEPPLWHFQGRLQTNKINRLRAYISVWQTVDSRERIEALAQRTTNATILIQVDSSRGRADRSGAQLEAVPELVRHARESGLNVAGLMTIAPLPEHGVGSARQAFEALKAMSLDLSLPECSMGMSDDLEDAVQAGSTMLRIGSALFGERTGAE